MYWGVRRLEDHRKAHDDAFRRAGYPPPRQPPAPRYPTQRCRRVLTGLGSGVGEQGVFTINEPGGPQSERLLWVPLQSRRVNTPGFEAWLFALLEGEHLVGLGGQPRHVGRGSPRAADRRQALLRRPTGDGAALSDVDGYPMIPELA